MIDNQKEEKKRGEIIKKQDMGYSSFWRGLEEKVSTRMIPKSPPESSSSGDYTV